MKISIQKKIIVSISLLCSLFVVFILSRVFSGEWMLPQMFKVGPLSIRYYGITMALAVGAGWWLALRRAPRYGFANEQADVLFQWLVVAGFVGARLYHVASSWQYYWQYPLDILKVWHGGLSIFGALIGGFLVLAVYTKMHQSVIARSERSGERRGKLMTGSATNSEIASSVGSLPPRNDKREGLYSDSRLTTHVSLLHVLDWLIPSVVLGQIIGRFGNFFNYEAFGYPTSVPWKMFVPVQFRPEELAQYTFFHPLFLYEALGNALILVVLLGCGRGKKWPAGSLFFLYLFLYNTLRFALEFLRVDSTFLWGFIRLNTLSSAVLCLVGIAGIVLKFTYASKSNNYPE